MKAAPLFTKGAARHVWCPRRELNSHALAGTRPSTRVRRGPSFRLVRCGSLWFAIQRGRGAKPSLSFLVGRAQSVRRGVRETDRRRHRVRHQPTSSVVMQNPSADTPSFPSDAARSPATRAAPLGRPSRSDRVGSSATCGR